MKRVPSRGSLHSASLESYRVLLFAKSIMNEPYKNRGYIYYCFVGYKTDIVMF